MKSWRRGSTPINAFKTNIDLSEATIYITYQQKNKTLVEKTGDDITVTPEQISCVLTQEETLKFEPGTVEIQIRYVLPDGTADASNIVTVSSTKILKDGVIRHV